MLCRWNSIPDADKTHHKGEDIFVSLLAPLPSKQKSPLTIFAEHYCTTIACYDNSLCIGSRIMLFADIILLQLLCNNNGSIVNGYSCGSNSDRYHETFTVGRDTRNSVISSFIVLFNSRGEVPSDSTAISISNHFVISYFGLDVTLSNSPILLYGTTGPNGDIFYVALPSTDNCFKELDLKSYFLCSINQPIVEILAFRILCSSDTLVGANSLFFIGKEGKICVLFSSGTTSDYKEFFLNVPVYSACFLKHHLLISSYKEIVVITIASNVSLSAALVEAFCNPNTLKINSVIRMHVDATKSIVIMTKRNGYAYSLDESNVISRLASPIVNNLQKVVTQIGEVSDKVDLLKANINVTEMCLKQVNNAINLFISVNLRDEIDSLINCQLFPEVYNQKIGIKLEMKPIEAGRTNTKGFFLSVQTLSSKFKHISSFYSLSSFTQSETFSQDLRFSIKDLPFQVTCIIYCDLTHMEFFNAKEALGISAVLKHKKFHVLDFLKEINSNIAQHPLCNIEGHLTLTQQTWKRLEKAFRTNSLLKEINFNSETANLQFASFALQKAITVHVYSINKDQYVTARLLTNSAAFVCELRAALVEKLKVICYLPYIHTYILMYI